MGNFRLIASKDRCTNQRVINIEGYDLTTLISIDRFTSNLSKSELEKIVKEKCNIDFNPVFSVVKNVGADKQIYFHAFIDDKDIKESLNNLTKKKVNYNNRVYNDDFLRQDSIVFEREKNIFLNLIEEKKYEKLYQIYKENNMMGLYIRRYLLSSHDNEFDKKSALDNLILEFSKYRNFRTWLANKKKILEFTFISSNINKTNYKLEKENKIVKTSKDIKLERPSISRESIIKSLMEDYEKEEFLEEDELDVMGFDL